MDVKREPGTTWEDGPKLDANKTRVGPGGKVTLRGQFPERADSGTEPVLKR